jgi:3-hydroxybutyryl-CoA dehydratase
MNEEHDCFPGVEVGTTVTYARTISESDVYLFAGISGDHSPNHTNAEYMQGTRFGQRIAHGALTLGLMSTCSTRLIEQMGDVPTVNYGYDKVRFTAPVYFGDTVSVSYVVAEVDRTLGRLRADVQATNQNRELVAVASNILRAVGA